MPTRPIYYTISNPYIVEELSEKRNTVPNNVTMNETISAANGRSILNKTANNTVPAIAAGTGITPLYKMLYSSLPVTSKTCFYCHLFSNVIKGGVMKNERLYVT